MNKKLLMYCLALLFTVQSSFSQTSTKGIKKFDQGKVKYERTSKMNAVTFNNQESGNNNPRIKIVNFELTFVNDQSLWLLVKKENDINNISGGNDRVGTISGNPAAEATTFTNLKLGIKMSERKIRDKAFVVEDSLIKLKWDYTGETKDYLGFKAYKAVAQKIGTISKSTVKDGKVVKELVGDTLNIVAWYTKDIPVQFGPDYSGQLPGLIVELDLNNGRTVYKAIEISHLVNSTIIKEPTNGIKISGSDFKLEQEKSNKELLKRFSSN